MKRFPSSSQRLERNSFRSPEHSRALHPHQTSIRNQRINALHDRILAFRQQSKFLFNFRGGAA